MNVAIFYDAAPVTGNARLLEQAKQYLFDLLSDYSAFHARPSNPSSGRNLRL